MPDLKIPDLRLTKLAYGTHETVIDLRNLLYLGGAAVRRDKTIEKINSGELGEVLMERLPLVNLLHAGLLSDISRGLRRSTINNRYKYTCYFYAWCDRNNHPITATSVVDGFYSWVESLISEIKAKKNKAFNCIQTSYSDMLSNFQSIEYKAWTTEEYATSEA
ncbi:hypothetical protein [Pseudomonas chlororaphis]|uniref:hypothetical protein n=1 Tax=Pseudomonas chlororaphis TaxID=587753 RepID=UPI003C29AF8E